MGAPVAYAGPAIVELMGHRQRAGSVSEVEMYGTKLLRIDIPAPGGDVTEFYGGSSIYGVHPCTAEVAAATANRLGDPRPVMPTAFRLTGPQSFDEAHYTDDFDAGEDDDV